MRRRTTQLGLGDDGDEDVESFVTEKFIVDSGRDVEGRPIFSVFGCRFPDPKHQNYDELLEACFRRLDDYVRNDYVIVFFAEPLHHSPSLGWMIKAYRRLSRNYKKNVQKLYIVHSSWWFKIVLGFMTKIVSSKFAAKIVILDRLAELPDHVPCEEMDIPDEIKCFDEKSNSACDTTVNEKSKQQATEAMTSKSLNKQKESRRKETLFGKELQIVTAGTIETPAPILSLIMYLRSNALDEEGLFRTSANANQINDLKERLDRGLDVQWSNFDIPTLAGLLKAYVRELPEPLIPPSTYLHLSDLSKMAGQVAICQYIEQFFLKPIDAQNMVLLKEIIALLRDTLEHSARNRLSLKSLTTVWTPNLIRHEDVMEETRRIESSRKLIAYLIEYYDDLF